MKKKKNRDSSKLLWPFRRFYFRSYFNSAEIESQDYLIVNFDVMPVEFPTKDMKDGSAIALRSKERPLFRILFRAKFYFQALTSSPLQLCV